MKFLYRAVIVSTIFYCGFVHAQFLPNNTSLNVQSVQRWMDSNRDFSAIIQTVDSLFKTDDEFTAFELLPAAEQDQKINTYLEQQKMFETAKAITFQHGWKSVGEYRRLSTKLGNAIAAYFLTEKMSRLTSDEKKTLREKSDPAIVAVPKTDIDFIQTNEKLLKSYIQAYSNRR